MKRNRKFICALLICASILGAAGCNQNNTPAETQKPETTSGESVVNEETTAGSDTVAETTTVEDTPVAEESTVEMNSIASIDSYDFNLDEAFDTTMENNMSDNIKFSVKLTALKDASFETAQDAYNNGFNESNSNSTIFPFEGFITYGDLCGMTGLELEPWKDCIGYNDDGTPKYKNSENLSIYHHVADKEQTIYTENGKGQGIRKFEYCGIYHDSITEKKNEIENQITTLGFGSTLLECVSDGEVITDRNATIPDDAIIKGISCGSSLYSQITFYMTLENGETIELSGEEIRYESSAKKYLREIGLITTEDYDEIYRYEMRDNDNARLLVFKNNDVVMVMQFTWNGGYLKDIFLIKR